MATVFKCDRCENIIKKQPFKLNYPAHDDFSDFGSYVTYDLCQLCTLELRDWFDKKAKK